MSNSKKYLNDFKSKVVFMKILAYTFVSLLIFSNSFSALASDNTQSDQIENYYWQFTSSECKKDKDTLHPIDYVLCKENAAEASRKELEAVFKEILIYIDKQDSETYSKQDKEEWKQTLKKSQANWEKYRDLEIDIHISMMMKGATGSGPSNVISGMQMEKNYQRIQELKISYDLDNIASMTQTQEVTMPEEQRKEAGK